ncbi:MAG: hypothetical protein RQ885_10275 [Desulfurococcales archaeon]|nr:hypothetical protein [Desulfurococcales archaeon]
MGVTISRYPISITILARACIKEAVGSRGSGDEICAPLDTRKISSRVCEEFLSAITRVAGVIIYRKGSSIYCRICGNGPYTRKGAYLHLLRKHLKDIEDILSEELERVASRDF